MPQAKPFCGFEAVLVMAFGGPEGPAEVGPFLESVLRGRPVPPGRLAELAGHYDRLGGVSPLTELTRRQARGLQQRLKDGGIDLPVYVGMRCWHPFLADTLAEMSRAGVARAIGFIAAAHHCWSSCGQYKQDVLDARRKLRDGGLADVTVTYVESWYDHPGFVSTIARHVTEAIDRLPPDVRGNARLVFTAHSIPAAMAEACRYREQVAATARLVAERLCHYHYTLVYQSRGGRPADPWLGPDVCDYLRAERAKGLPAVVLVPIGFVCDHVEVLYDLDVQAAGVCRELGLPMVRAATVNDDPEFIDVMADVVQRTHERCRRFPPLPIVADK